MSSAPSSFEYHAKPCRVLFGRGSIQKLPEEVKRLGKVKPLLLSGPRQSDRMKPLEAVLEHASITPAGTFANATMHTPIHMTEEALKYAIDTGADILVSFGGGSAVGLGKALSVRTGLKHICVPTTYAGSEMTSVLGETVDKKKTTRSDDKILPYAVIYDVDFTMTLSPAMSATSGMNAIAHAVEALYAENTNPVTDLLAQEGIKALAESLPVIVDRPDDVEARVRALYGAWLCATCLGTVGMSLHHKLCHTFGGTLGMPHSETHTIVLPHAIAYNSPNISEAQRKLAAVLPDSDGDAIKGLNVLLEKLRVKRGLKEFGMREDDIDIIADTATGNPYWNPRPIERAPLRETIRRCWAGEEARADL
ncbi:putative maleylacetate reductase [Neohortaea acidophila]|uniref:Putative maleylacetate reductase n=1 Tax=Neohortaea acidophila TaxID=245834 RepID=A0A6A6Q2Q3_9PEZI|nr:putative maleylacetate reductase [Neohortaea acidophila]KAF2486680.1 putative maleylacetate reductase [Neohortaea acidophila]